MAGKSFVLKLARLMAAVAWADGIVTNSEISTLKDLLFSIPSITDDDWKKLELYLDHPVADTEKDELLQGLLEDITSEEDKKKVFEILDSVIDSDGTATRDEFLIMEEIREAVEAKQVGLKERLSGLLGLRINRRKQALSQTPSREERIDDYIKNNVYFRLVTELPEKDKLTGIPENHIRKLCLAAGLMARVAWVDSGVSEQERQSICSILIKEFDLSSELSRLITSISTDSAVKGLDLFRLCRSYYEVTEADERKQMLKTLFKIANCDLDTSAHEIEEIRRISSLLRLDHKDFIDAKLTVPSENRHGM